MDDQKTAYIKRSIQTLKGSTNNKEINLTVLKTTLITPNNFKVIESCSEIIQPKHNILVEIDDKRIDKFNVEKKATYYYVALNNIFITKNMNSTELSYDEILNKQSQIIKNISVQKEYTIFEKTYNNTDMNEFWHQYHQRL